VLLKAQVLLAVGGGLDEWALQAARAVNSQCEVVVLTEALGFAGPGGRKSPTPSRPNDGNRDAGGPAAAHRAGAGTDPHIWLDPVLARRIGEVVAEVLSEKDPSGRRFYEERLSKLKERLDRLDAEYRSVLAACGGKTFMVFHPAFGHLARRYGLKQVRILGPTEAGSGSIEQAIDRIRTERIRAVYREPQFDSRWVQWIHERTGLKVLVLDPLGNPAREGYDGYFAMMRSNLAALKEGLCGEQ